MLELVESSAIESDGSESSLDPHSDLKEPIRHVTTVGLIIHWNQRHRTLQTHNYTGSRLSNCSLRIYHTHVTAKASNDVEDRF
jgi:hypothetical protein